MTDSDFQRFTGIIPLAGYQVIIYQMIGTDQLHSLIFTVVWGIVTTAGAGLGGFWLDKVGRRNALVSVIGTESCYLYQSTA